MPLQVVRLTVSALGAQTAVAITNSGPGRTTGGSLWACTGVGSFVFGQPLLDERHLEHFDHLLAVGVRCAEPGATLASYG